MYVVRNHQQRTTAENTLEFGRNGTDQMTNAWDSLILQRNVCTSAFPG